MKKLVLSCVLILITSTAAFAVTGGSQLICQSSANSDSKQSLHVEIVRMNGPGTSAPSVKISINGTNYPISTPYIGKQYGQTIHDAALGVIVVNANNYGASKKNQLSIQIMAVPGSVKAFNREGNQVKWSLQNDDGGKCIDGNGKATFQGIFTGNLQTDTGYVPVDNQIMDCTLTYNTGSAC